MATIFTRARAANKMVALFERECGIPRSRLRCDCRLETDLGIVGDDTWSLLEAMQREGIDMSGFDCGDRITPEGAPALPLLIWLGVAAALSLAWCGIAPFAPGWCIFVLATTTAAGIVVTLSRFLPSTCHEELRVKDLIDAAEAGSWRSPKANTANG